MILPLSRLPTPIPTRHKIGCPHTHLRSSCFGLLRKYAPRLYARHPANLVRRPIRHPQLPPDRNGRGIHDADIRQLGRGDVHIPASCQDKAPQRLPKRRPYLRRLTSVDALRRAINSRSNGRKKALLKCPSGGSGSR